MGRIPGIPQKSSIPTGENYTTAMGVGPSILSTTSNPSPFNPVTDNLPYLSFQTTKPTKKKTHISHPQPRAEEKNSITIHLPRRNQRRWLRDFVFSVSFFLPFLLLMDGLKEKGKGKEKGRVGGGFVKDEWMDGWMD